MRRNWRTWLLALGVLATALSVVYVRHDGRRGFVELQALEQKRDELTTDWGRLQIEYATWADGSRVERLAKQQLALRDAEAAKVMVVLE